MRIKMLSSIPGIRFDAFEQYSLHTIFFMAIPEEDTGVGTGRYYCIRVRDPVHSYNAILFTGSGFKLISIPWSYTGQIVREGKDAV